MDRTLSFDRFGDVSAQPAEADFEEMTIRQMSQLFNVSLRTLRFYEDKGFIKPRREGSVRQYRAADRARMEIILRGKKLGFTLSEIIELVSGNGANNPQNIEETLHLDQVVKQIKYLERQRDEIVSAIDMLRTTNDRLLKKMAA